jgi:hypothetical protein
MRGVPHTLALSTSVESPQGPRTGWSGDGAPGDGSLRSFATGAVIQHFTKSLGRVAGVDFRLPTDEELDALQAFQLSLGRQRDIALPLALKGAVARRGQAIFLDDRLGKCNLCHLNAGANARTGGNANFDTGVEDLPDRPAQLGGELVPPDDGFGRPGDRTFNTPPLVEAASTPPFFHDNSVATLEVAVGFYDGAAFNASPAGRFLKSIDPAGRGIELDATQISAVAAFLRVLNALEAIRRTEELLAAGEAMRKAGRDAAGPLGEAKRQLRTGAAVLAEGGIHAIAVRHLERAIAIVGRCLEGGREIQDALAEMRWRGRPVEEGRSEMTSRWTWKAGGSCPRRGDRGLACAHRDVHPIGKSPPVEHTLIGTISAVDATARRITCSGEAGSTTVQVTERTRIWLDRTPAKLPNLKGTLSDCRVGRRLEAKYVNNERTPGAEAEWIKVEVSAPEAK